MDGKKLGLVLMIIVFALCGPILINNTEIISNTTIETDHQCDYEVMLRYDRTIWEYSALTGEKVDNLLVVKQIHHEPGTWTSGYWENIFGVGYRIYVQVPKHSSYYLPTCEYGKHITREVQLEPGNRFVNIQYLDTQTIEEGENTLEFHIVYKNAYVCKQCEKMGTYSGEEYYYVLVYNPEDPNFRIN